MGADVSREGVQRDLLPLVEGCTVSTKHGMVKTDHVLFIASGAFHMAKPSDLIPELQGRLPIRVELDPLSVDDFERILSEPDASLCEQYTALLGTEGVGVKFTKDGIRRIAEIAWSVNEKTENIGARRLHTVMERLLEQDSFDAADRSGTSIEVDAAFVDRHLGALAKDEDLSRYILMNAPTGITVKPKSRVVEVEWPDGARYALPFEYLRVYSPSAEVRGHGGGEGKLELAKESVKITQVEQVGVYAVRLHFDDGHNTGLFTWAYLRELGEQYDEKWSRYLERCEALGYERKPPA